MKTMSKATWTWLSAAVVAWAGLTTGCKGGRSSASSGQPARQNESPATKKAPDLPKLPGEQEQADGAMELMITTMAASRPAGGSGYVVDEHTPSGNLVGAVKFKGALIERAHLPPAKPLDLTGPGAILNPDKGEEDYYRNLRLKETRYLHHDYYNVPTYTVLMLRGIRKGRRPELDRAVFMVRQGAYEPHIGFGPVGERVMFGTYDSYPTDVFLSAMEDGRLVMQEQISAFDRDTIKPLGGGGVHYTARPKMDQSPVLKDIGGYAVTSQRHPWKKAYVFVVDNPYCLVGHGRFSLDAVPVGTWKIDVWHPQFEPAQKSYQVDIKKDDTTEVAIELKVPSFLAASQPAGKP